MKFDILIVDDDRLVRSSLRRLLTHPEWRVAESASVKEAREALRRSSFDVAILDYKLGDGTGLDVLDTLREVDYPTIPVMLTAYGTVTLAVEALHRGACDFLQKDGEPQLMRHVVEKALERCRLRKEVQALRKERLERASLPQIICQSDAMRRTMVLLDEYAATDATVLIEGETGVGKSLLAEFIHFASARHAGPFITINCGAIPKELIESELFGYEEGAFTGAKARGKIGLIKRADGGTLFLDEIGDLSLDLQSKLLHVLERREFLAVGAVEPTRVDVRFIAATNANLTERIAENRFRRDLYYRLNVAGVQLQPLRQRRADILPLARHLIHRLNQQYGKQVVAISPEAEQLLVQAPWPGNVRELRNTLERAMLLKKGDTLEVADLSTQPGHEIDTEASGDYRLGVQFGVGEDVLQVVTRQLVLEAWQRSDHNQSQAARLLGIPRTTFQTYVQKYDL